MYVCNYICISYITVIHKLSLLLLCHSCLILSTQYQKTEYYPENAKIRPNCLKTLTRLRSQDLQQAAAPPAATLHNLTHRWRPGELRL